MKAILTSFLVLATSLETQARLIQDWSGQEFFEESGLVVIAMPTTSCALSDQEWCKLFRESGAKSDSTHKLFRTLHPRG